MERLQNSPLLPCNCPFMIMSSMLSLYAPRELLGCFLQFRSAAVILH